jgi:hypothetical protein
MWQHGEYEKNKLDWTMFMNHVNGLIIIITNGGFYGIDHNLMVDNF